MSLNQIELVWVRVGMEWECFWVNLREENKVSESKMAVSESNMEEFRMAAIIKLSQNEWVKVFLGVNSGNQSWQMLVSLRGKTKMAECKLAEFKMAAIIKLSQNEWVKFFLCKMAVSKMAEFKMAAIIKFSQNEWVKFFLWKMAESKMAEFKMVAINKLIRLN